MPATSRKRNKGKERKAKKAESERVLCYKSWQGWARGNVGLATFGGSIDMGATVQHVQCSHGLEFDELPDISHPVSRFITSFLMGEDSTSTLQIHAKVWNNDNYREMAIRILTNIGANWVICKIENDGGSIARLIILLESYGRTRNYELTIASRDVSTKMREIKLENVTSNNRDLIKFFRKRMNCKCLKKIHLEARKTLPKLGSCRYCNVVKDRVLLMVCSRCMVTQFCSRKCQVAASSRHRKDCDQFVWAHHQQKMANDSSNML